MVASKEKAINTIENVSAVSEETAATTQEVSASTEEQIASAETLSGLASGLREMSGELSRAISIFKVGRD